MVVVADDLSEQTSAAREENPCRAGLDARSVLPERFRMRDPTTTQKYTRATNYLRRKPFDPQFKIYQGRKLERSE